MHKRSIGQAYSFTRFGYVAVFITYHGACVTSSSSARSALTLLCSIFRSIAVFISSQIFKPNNSPNKSSSMAKTAKSTRKFQGKHLKHTLEHRKEVQKHNKIFAARNKKKTPVDENAPPPPSAAAKEVFKDMPTDEFFEAGFEVPKEKKSKKSKKVESDEESSDEEDLEAMQESLKNLEDKDPEFYKYLKNNDTKLLDFEGVNPLDAISDDEDEGAEDGENNDEKEIFEGDDEDEPVLKKGKQIIIDTKLVDKWTRSLENPSLRIIKAVVVAFRSAVNVNNADSKVNDEESLYTVNDPKAFTAFLMLGLKTLPDAIQKLIKYKINNRGARTIPEKDENFNKVAALMKYHAAAYVTLLKDMSNTETAAIVLTSMQEIIPYYLPHKRILKKILAAIVESWANTQEVETQIATFAFLNNVSREFPHASLEIILKLTYSSFLANCRKTNLHTMPLINFSKNSAAELFGADEALGYQVGFEYVRQLAIHLRNSINATSNAQEGYKTIYNWQYAHSLDFWSRVVSLHCNPEKEALKHKSKESPLRQLIYPLVQVTLGAMRLIPTAQFFPFRFYLVRSLIRLSQGTGVFIPIFPLIAEVLTSTTITRSPKNTPASAKLQPFLFDDNIKVNQAYLGTRIFQDGVCEQFVELTSEFFSLYARNIAFPELATPAILALRRFSKKSKNSKFNRQLQQLIEKLTANSTFISTKRSNVSYGPSNRTEVNQFLRDFEWDKTPLGQYVVVQRTIKEEKVRILREAALAEEDESKDKVDEDGDLEIASEGEESEDEQ